MKLRDQIIEFGASKVGFADIRNTPAERREGLPFGISIGVALNPAIIRGIANGPTVDYHHEYNRINSKLNNNAEKTADYIRNQGFAASPQTTTIVVTDKNNETNILPHKTVATLGGMGWIGKNALLITPEFGSAIRLTSVYTDKQLETDTPVIESECGSCRRCVDVCPADAMTGNNWARDENRDYIYNASKCRAEAKRQCAAIGINNTICGICINVCPYTKRYIGV